MRMLPIATGKTNQCTMTNTLKTVAVSAKGLSCSMTQVALLLLSSLGLLLPMIAGQPGFINIDCGSTSNYTDPNTHLVWTTDDGYVSTGSNKNVSNDLNADSTANFQQLSTARYFQQSRKKHCYVLPVTNNNSYLIRASFLYGDLEVPRPSKYSFKLSIDSTIVETVSISSSNFKMALHFQYLVASTSQQIAFCIIPVVGNAFISSLELKTLLPTMYRGRMFQSKYMKILYTINFNQFDTDPMVRYPNDEYDRLWTSQGSGEGIDFISTTNKVDVGEYDKPPMTVMQTAWTADNGFWFNWTNGLEQETNTEMYYVLYFVEVSRPNATDVRTIDVSVNNRRQNDIGVTVSTFATEFSSIPPWRFDRSGNSKIQMLFNLTKNPASTLPPLLNGAEIHAVYDMDSKTTRPAEVSALYELRQNLNLFEWTGDPCLPVSWDWLNCSSTDPPTVTQLKLSGYQLSGTIPESIAEFTDLTDLWLDNNNLTGGIPNLAPLAHLSTLHLQNNSLTGSIPASLVDISHLSELFLTDNNLDGPVPAGLYKNGLDLRVDNFAPEPTPKKKSGNSGAVIGAVIGVIVVVILLAVLVVFLWWRRRNSNRKTQPHVAITGKQSGGVGSHHAQMTRAFSKAEVQNATENFGKKIGEGGFGPVYYGKLTTGQEVAVKVNSTTSGQGWDEFSNEVNLLSRVHHRNLVSLVGFCDEGEEKILIYEYMHYGTLREHLYGKGLTEVVDWQTRLDIALGAAQGLEYLHYGCSPKIIHRDVKSNNILLNEKLLAKVADFGISKLTLDDAPTRGFTTIVRGTNGYLDPECLSTNKITQKSDVYAFGVVLLEIITGRSPNDNTLANTLQLNLVQYARGLLRDGNLEQIVDPALSGSYNIEAMWKLAELAMYCVEPVGQSRPDMRQVVRDVIEAVNLENLQDFRLMTPKESPGPGGASALLAQYETQSSIFSHVPSSDSSEWTNYPGPR